MLNLTRKSNGLLISPTQASREGAGRLMPYLYNVDMRFWDEHTGILRHANVLEVPNLGQLLESKDLWMKRILT